MFRRGRLISVLSVMAVLFGTGLSAKAEEGAAMAALSSGSAGGAEVRQAQDEKIYHLVTEGETLGSIALKYKVAIQDLTGWNELASIHDLEPGVELVVGSKEEARREPRRPLPVVHIVKSGDTFEGIANRYGVTVSQVRQWNRNVHPRRIQIGQQIHLHIPGSSGVSVSWGRANGGRLYNGVAMESSPGMRVRNQARAYGTQRVVNLLYAAGADVQARWPDAPDLIVGSLSLRNGGRMRPHRSHQSGRDVDLTYYHRGNVALSEFFTMTPDVLDAVKNWHLYKTLIDSGEVQFIFVDYALQEVLYEYALSIGYTPEELEPLFQYPRGRNVPVGIIRHARGHAHHAHIRFICGPQDQNCH